MRPSIAARSFWSFSTSKKPPQFAGTRFQILGIGDGDFSWHAQKIVQFPANRKGRDLICASCQVLVSRRAGARDGKLFRPLSSDRDDLAQLFPDRLSQS